MSTITLNISKIIRDRLNYPHVKLGNNQIQPVYAHLDSIQKSEYEKSAEYQQMVKSGKINSPTNIRRIFITYNRIYVEYFCPVGVYGKEVYASEVKTSSYNSNIDKLFVATPQGLTSNLVLQGDQGAFQIQPQGDTYRIDAQGNVSNLLTYPFNMNNVEEVYFDWILLLAPDGQAVYKILTGRDLCSADIASMITNNVPQVQQVDNIVYSLVGGDQKQFKRLRTVAFISGLENLLNMYKSGSTYSLERLGPLGNIRTIRRNDENDSYLADIYSKSWLEYHKDWVAQVGGLTAFCDTGMNNSKNRLFDIKSDQFIFDKTYLADRVNIFKTYINPDIKVNQPSKAEIEEAAKAVEKNDESIEVTKKDNSELEELTNEYSKSTEYMENVSGKIDQLALEIKNNELINKDGYSFVVNSLIKNFGYTGAREKALILSTIENKKVKSVMKGRI